jgi:hypothetical protein
MLISIASEGEMKMRDRMFLVEPGFRDADYPGGTHDTFYCPDCLTVEGVLALYPEALANLEVCRVPFERPRNAVVELIGEDDQDLPKLVLAEDAPQELATGSHNGTRFVSGVKEILAALSERYGIPRAHF